jgi:hypothetical protein
MLGLKVDPANSIKTALFMLVCVSGKVALFCAVPHWPFATAARRGHGSHHRLNG